jgi:hypothetical protein
MGIVAKPLASPYRPGEREWVQAKNRRYWRFRAGARAGPEPADGRERSSRQRPRVTEAYRCHRHQQIGNTATWEGTADTSVAPSGQL